MKPRRAQMKRTELAQGKPIEQKGQGPTRARKVCSVDDCHELARGLGFCNVHYARFKRHGDPVKVITVEDRFLDAVEEGPVPEHRPDLGPCLLYTGATNTGGYGQFRYNGRNGYAHRYAWERVHGPIKDDLTVDHLCRVRRCVRVEHFELVDAVTNYLRGVATRTACHRGHPYTPENTKMRRGRRQCLTCQRDAWRRCEAKRKAARGPDSRVKHAQDLVRIQIALVRSAQSTIADAARVIGCNPNYLGRRVWEETKRDVFDRDEHACCHCGTAAGLDAHHRRPRGRGGSSSPAISFSMANLVSLCRRCHDHIESHREWATTAGWLLPRRLAQITPEEWPVLRWTAHGPRWMQPGDEWTPATPHPRQVEMGAAA